MFRFSLIVCVSLIVGITAKPYKPWNKPRDGAVQDTVVSTDDKGKMSWGVEVEPPENMDQTHYDIDPRMKIWLDMMASGLDKQPVKAEEDMDELYHPSVADLLKVQMQTLDALPAADIQTKVSQEDMTYNQKPEEDRDNIDHPVFSNVPLEEPEQDLDEVYEEQMKVLMGYLAPLMAEHKAAHSEPEMDEDELHHDNQHPIVETQPLKHKVRVHLQAEEDMDVLYHKDLPELVLYQVDAEADVPVHFPRQRRHTEPEEDLDGFYHQ
ncbi:hypothetical protein Q5P01_021412 [Channa striata]|uniref:Uncharacterized protein n=1 Tax=Channa striata TaxID=64152 RepID=A0AA88LU59_CHASR|nr:hypothetical protein Q5P01_021412 [Channa striata]